MRPFPKTLCALAAAAICILPLTGKTQGYLSYGMGSTGVERHVFLPDPNNPTVAKYGGSNFEYAGFRPVEGPGVYAELWWAPTQDPTSAVYAPIPGSKTTFRTAPGGAGLIVGKSKLEIPGTYGGDIVLLQLRVWENLNGALQTWEQALTTSGIARGEIQPFLFELGGFDRNGTPKLGYGSFRFGVPNFSLALAVPEPGCLGFLLLGLAGINLFSRKSHLCSAR